MRAASSAPYHQEPAVRATNDERRRRLRCQPGTAVASGKRQNVAALELPANDYITYRVNPVDLKNRLCDVETDCRDRLHVWLLRIVGASTAPTCMALPCRCRSRPQHHKRTFESQQKSRVLSQASIRKLGSNPSSRRAFSTER